MDFIGLDIGSSSFKAVELHREPHLFPKLTLYAQSPAPGVSINSDSETDLKTVAGALRSFVDAFPFSSRAVVVALPESQIFTRVITLPRMTEKELKNAMQWETEQYIPIPLTEVNMDWQVLDDLSRESESNQMDVLIVASPKSIISKYLKVLKLSSLDPLAIETETMAIARSLVGADVSTPVTMTVNIGAATTDIAVVKNGTIRFTRSISTGGTALARAVSQSLGFDLQQAEEYKKAYGLDETKLEGKVMHAIKPIFDVIVEEIKRSLAFYNTHKKEEKVKRVILSGGTASLPGIIVYLASTLDVEVQLGNPWRFVDKPPKFTDKELEEVGPSFATAVGLALKEISLL